MTETNLPATPSSSTTNRLGAAAYLGVSPRTVGKLIRSGELPSLRIGRLRRITWAALSEFLQKKTAEAMAEKGGEVR